MLSHRGGNSASSTTSTGNPSRTWNRRAHRSHSRWSPWSINRVVLGLSGQRRIASRSGLIIVLLGVVVLPGAAVGGGGGPRRAVLATRLGGSLALPTLTGVGQFSRRSPG